MIHIIYWNDNMKRSVIYSNNNQESERAISLISSLGYELRVFIVGEDFTQTEFEMEFGSDASYPQVTIGTNHVGTLKETLRKEFLQT